MSLLCRNVWCRDSCTPRVCTYTTVFNFHRTVIYVQACVYILNGAILYILTVYSILSGFRFVCPRAWRTISPLTYHVIREPYHPHVIEMFDLKHATNNVVEALTRDTRLSSCFFSQDVYQTGTTPFYERCGGWGIIFDTRKM